MKIESLHRTLLANMAESRGDFGMYGALQGQFAEVRSELIQNPVTWIRTQQQFFFVSFEIVLLFVLEPGEIADQFEDRIIWFTTDLKD